MFRRMMINIRRWFSLLFNKSEEISKIIKTQIPESYYEDLERYKQIYAGYYPEWHDTRSKTISGKNKKRVMNRLNMAKVVSEHIAKIIFTEKVVISSTGKASKEFTNKVLEDNRFYRVFQAKLESMFALGGLILKAFPKERPDGQYELKISYITPDAFIPISYEDGVITEGAFISEIKRGEKTYYLLEVHEWEYVEDDSKDVKPGDKVKAYKVTNKLYEQNKQGTKVKNVPLKVLYENLEETTYIRNLTKPLFQYLKPNINNNKDLQSPLGIPIYANALDTLKTIDRVFDSFFNEFRLGKRRIIVPSSAVKTVVDPQTGIPHRYFDDDDEVYEAINYSDPNNQKIIDSTVGLRVDEHISALNALLNILSMQIGVSPGTFTFDGTTVKTATEIISEQSMTYQTKEANENLIEEALNNFIITLHDLANLFDIENVPSGDDIELNFYWDDSIIQDRDSDADFYIKLAGNDLISKKYALMKILNLTEDDATKMLLEIKEEKTKSIPDLSDLGSFNAQQDELDNNALEEEEDAQEAIFGLSE